MNQSPSPSSSSASWICEIDGKEFGPLTAQQVRGLAKAGRLKPTHRIRKLPQLQWMLAKQIRGLFGGSETAKKNKTADAPSRGPNLVPSQDSIASAGSRSTATGNKRELKSLGTILGFRVASSADIIAVSTKEDTLGFLELDTGKITHQWNCGGLYKPEVGLAATVSTLKSLFSLDGVQVQGALMSARMCVSADGKRVVIALPEKRSSFSLVKKYTTRVLLADTANPDVLTEVTSVEGCIEAMSIASGDNSLWFAQGAKNGAHVQRWNVDTRTLQAEFSVNLKEPPVRFAFSAKGDLLAVAAQSEFRAPSISVWKLADGELRCELKIPGVKRRRAAPCPILPHTLQFSTCGTRLLTASGEKNTYQKQNYGMMGALIGGPIGGLVGSVKEMKAKAIATAAQVNSTSLRSWDTSSGEPVADIVNLMGVAENSIRGAAISPDGQLALTAGFGNDVRLWDLEKATHLECLYEVSETTRVDLRMAESDGQTERYVFENFEAMDPSAAISGVAFSSSGKEAIVSLHGDTRLHVISFAV